jgi:broad specificity phosphatase PhoE
MPTRLLLVRHGESEWNALGRWQGQADPPLSDLGRAQARCAAQSLASIDAVFSSTLQRARETAEIIAGELGIGPVECDDDLMERDAGEWSGLTRADIEEKWPGYLTGTTAFQPGQPAQRRPPGWERDDSLLTRALRGLGRVVSAVPDGDALVVTHGGLVYCIESHLGAPFGRIANLEGRWVTADGGPSSFSLGDRIRLVDPNEVAVTVPDQL